MVTTMSLKKIMEELIKLGDFTMGTKQEIRLSRGLLIGIRSRKEKRILEISREGVQPSMAEWIIVCEKAGLREKITPMIEKENGRIYLRGEFKKSFQGKK